jgi:hypothetical protein
LDPLTGSIRVKYRYRATSDASDTDLYEIVSLAYGNPRRIRHGAVERRLAEDLDGHKNVNGFYPFTSSDDRYSKWATERLYTAYLDFQPRESGVQIRPVARPWTSFPKPCPWMGRCASSREHSSHWRPSADSGKPLRILAVRGPMYGARPSGFPSRKGEGAIGGVPASPG